MWGVAQGARGHRQVAGAAEGCGQSSRLLPSTELWRELAAGRLVPVLAAGSLELAESLAQAGTVPVAGTKQHQDQQQQEAEWQPRGQGPGGCRVKASWKVCRAEKSTPRKGRGQRVRSCAQRK